MDLRQTGNEDVNNTNIAHAHIQQTAAVLQLKVSFLNQSWWFILSCV
jgi:hypothetical protein